MAATTAGYPFVWLDAIHYKVREDGRYVSKAIYTILGLTIDRTPWVVLILRGKMLSVLTDLHNRGVEDILIACVDGPTGFPEAIASIYPDTEVQQCVIHQIRNSLVCGFKAPKRVHG